MLSMLAVCLPFFALVGLGYVAGRQQWLPVAALPGLNALVMLLTLPALLVQMGRAWAGQGFAGVGLVPAYALASLGVVAVAFVLARRAGLMGVERSFAALVTAFPNTGFMGLPLLGGLLGAGAAAPVVATIVFDLVVTTTLCLVKGGGTARQGLALAVRNPLPWAVALGLAMGAAGTVLPAPLEQVLGLLAQACTAVALVTLGLVLAAQAAQAHRQALGPDRAATDRVGLQLALVKLLLHPTLAWGAALLAQAQGWLDARGCALVVLAAALPSAANVALLAQRMGADNPAVPRTVMLSTAAALLTVPLWAWLLGVRV
jgi:malonate transporter and related proteins